MKKIGLLGGMSWESTVSYYAKINEGIKQALGGLHSAECLLYSVDFQPIEKLQSQGEWEKAGELLAEAARSLERGGAEGILICTNTMHKVYDAVASAVNVPVLHIADASAAALAEAGIRNVALLGTRYTMEQDFYKGRLQEKGFGVLVPEAEERTEINRVIFEELCLGILSDTSRDFFLQVIDSLCEKGAEGILLGCTEIGLLVRPEDTKARLFDTTQIHAECAIQFALEGENNRE